MTPINTLLTAATVSVIACAASADTLTVRNDYGGRVDYRQRAVAALLDTGGTVRLSGVCNSACTMYLALGPKRLCAEPGVVFGFHAATDARTKAVLPYWNDVLAAHYPKPVAVFFREHAAHVTEGIVRVRGSDLIRLGFVSECAE